MTVQQMIALGKAEVGYHEGRNANGTWNNNQKYSDEVPGLEWSDWQPWCATFVSWLAMKGGMASYFPRTASCREGANWFKARKQFSEYPAIGAQAFYGPNGGTHTGLVYAYDATYVYTIEGNTNNSGSAEGDGVYYKKRLRRSTYVHGYGYPNVPLQSADPRYSANPIPAFPGVSAFVLNKSNPAVTKLGQRLIAKGYARHHDGDGYQAGPVFTTYDIANVKDFQKAQGWTGSDADGYPGPETWKRLFA